MARTKLTALQAAIDYLKDADGPQPVKAVCEHAATEAKLKGKTPSATVAAKIYTLAKKGETFKLVSRGIVELLPEKAPAETKAPVEKPETVASTPPVQPETKREVKADPKPSGSKKRSGRATSGATA